MSLNATLDHSIDITDDLSDRQRQTSAFVSAECNMTLGQILENMATCAVGISSGRKALRDGIGHGFRLYSKVLNDPEAQQELISRLKEAGKWNTSQRLLNAILGHYLGVKRKPASKYSRVVLAALEEGVSHADFEKFIKKSGGIEAIAKRRSTLRNMDDTSASELVEKDAEVVDVKSTTTPSKSEEKKVKVFANWALELKEFCEINTGFSIRNKKRRVTYWVRIFVSRDGAVHFEVMEPFRPSTVGYESPLYE